MTSPVAHGGYFPYAMPITPMSPSRPVVPDILREVEQLRMQLQQMHGECQHLQEERDALQEDNNEIMVKLRSCQSRMKAKVTKMEEEARQLNSENQNLRAEMDTQSNGSVCEGSPSLSSSDPNACWGRDCTGPAHAKQL